MGVAVEEPDLEQLHQERLLPHRDQLPDLLRGGSKGGGVRRKKNQTPNKMIYLEHRLYGSTIFTISTFSP